MKKTTKQIKEAFNVLADDNWVYWNGYLISERGQVFSLISFRLLQLTSAHYERNKVEIFYTLWINGNRHWVSLEKLKKIYKRQAKG